MARARNIKPGLYKNEDLAECSVLARYIFPGLWMLADREGRLEDRPKRIKAELLPFDDGDMDKLLQELHDRKFLVRYQNDDGRFIQISKFREHQSPHYSEKPSVIKPPILRESSEKIVETCSNAIPGTLQESSESEAPIKRGSQPPDSLIPSSLIPDSLIPDSLIPDSKTDSSEPAQKPRSSKPSVRRKTFAERWQGEVVCMMPVVGNGGSLEVPIRSDFVDELQAAYPRVDVAATLLEARAWCVSNPSRRKTPAGVAKFLNGWMSREQDRG